jgi:hypothetical protein
MLNVTPTAALLPKKPEEAPTLEVGPTETVEPGLVGRVPYTSDVKEIGLLVDVVVGLLAILDVAPTVELKKIVKHLYEGSAKASKTYLMVPGEVDARALEEENDDDASVDDTEAEEEAALVPGEVDVGGDDEGAGEELSRVADGCEEEEGEGEENAWEDACVAAADCEGVGLDSEAESDVAALA